MSARYRLLAPHTWPVSAWAILIANAAPLVGVLLMGWELAPLFYFYWMETLVIGGFTVLRILLAGHDAPRDHTGLDAPLYARLIMIPFFCFHFGLFCCVHGAFISIFLHGAAPGAPLDPFHRLFSYVDDPLLFLLPVIAAHAISFWRNDIRAGELGRTGPGEAMARPYARIVVMHVVLIVAGVAARPFPSFIPALIALVGLKTLLDVGMHLRLHRRAAVDAEAG